jgi:hypothetical protein
MEVSCPRGLHAGHSFLSRDCFLHFGTHTTLPGQPARRALRKAGAHRCGMVVVGVQLYMGATAWG